MEKQEIAVTDLTDWVIVYNTPMQYWLGKLANQDEYRQHVGLPELDFEETYLLLTHDMAQQNSQTGQLGFMRLVNCTGIGEFVGKVPMRVKVQAVTACVDLEKADQDAIRRCIDKRRAENTHMRAKRSGIITG